LIFEEQADKKSGDILYGGVCRFLRAAYGVLPAAFRKKIR
jgi:hypothetical protein